jgi:hypothetical protein
MLIKRQFSGMDKDEIHEAVSQITAWQMALTEW